MYRMRLWFYTWNIDEDYDIVFSVAKVVHFVKYKDYTFIRFGLVKYERAPKFLYNDIKVEAPKEETKSTLR